MSQLLRRVARSKKYTYKCQMISDIFIHLPTSLKYGYVLVRDLINEETMIMFWPRSDIKEVNDCAKLSYTRINL